MFVVGTAMIGITHQASWLIRGPVIDRTEKYDDHLAEVLAYSQFEQLGLAAGIHTDSHETIPAPSFTFEGQPLHSWHTHLLPFLEQGNLYRRIRHDRPWNDPANRDVCNSHVGEFVNPGISIVGDPPGVTHFAPDVRLFDQPRTMHDFPQGTSNTMLAADAVTRPRPWADPLNWRDPALGLNTHPDGFASPWPNGRCLVVFLDGSVRAVDPGQWDRLVRRVPID